MAEHIDNVIADILTYKIRCEDNNVFLETGSMERKTYEAVNEIFTRLRGKWDKRKKAHIFPYNPEYHISAIAKSRIMPDKNPLAFFPTPPDYCDYLVNDNRITENWHILEPSAGTGNIIDSLLKRHPKIKITAVELDPINVCLLHNRFKEYPNVKIIEYDFTRWEPNELFDGVVMNPPFGVENDKLAYVTHIVKAFKHLNKGGRLISVLPRMWFYDSKNKRSDDFYNFVVSYLVFCEESEYTFDDTGANVSTIIMDKHEFDSSFASREFSMIIGNDFETYRELQRFLSKTKSQDELYEWYLVNVKKIRKHGLDGHKHYFHTDKTIALESMNQLLKYFDSEEKIESVTLF
jgi:predicted RNA methylase